MKSNGRRKLIFQGTNIYSGISAFNMGKNIFAERSLMGKIGGLKKNRRRVFVRNLKMSKI